MLRSRFFPAVCNCLKSTDDIFEICRDAAYYAASRLGPGHSEKTYENVILNTLYQQRIPTLRQAQYFSNIDGQVVQTGIVDLEVDQKVILELKVGHTNISEDHRTQAKRYLRSARQKYQHHEIIASVILFSKHGDVQIWKCKSLPTSSRIMVTPENTAFHAEIDAR